MLIVAGLHVPLMPSIEVVGNAVAADPWQNGPMGAKLTATSGLIVILMVAVEAHWPGFGVNVYVVVPTFAVFIVAGLHVPEIPSVDLEGRTGATLFWQNGPIGFTMGFTTGLMLTIIVTILPHCPALGVKV